MTQEKPLAIVDTNILSYAHRRRGTFVYICAPASGTTTAHLVRHLGGVSLRRGKRRWSQRRRIELEHLLRKYPVVPYSEGMDRLHARIRAERAREGRPPHAAMPGSLRRRFTTTRHSQQTTRTSCGPRADN